VLQPRNLIHSGIPFLLYVTTTKPGKYDYWDLTTSHILILVVIFGSDIGLSHMLVNTLVILDRTSMETE
jgi:hypothetical protein